MGRDRAQAPQRTVTILWVAPGAESSDVGAAAGGAVDALRVAGLSVELVGAPGTAARDRLDQTLLRDDSPVWRVVNEAELCVFDLRGDPDHDGWLLTLAERCGGALVFGTGEPERWVERSWRSREVATRIGRIGGPPEPFAPLAVFVPPGVAAPPSWTAPVRELELPLAEPVTRPRSVGPLHSVGVLARGRAAMVADALCDAMSAVPWLRDADITVRCLPSEVDDVAKRFYSGALRAPVVVAEERWTTASGSVESFDVVLHLDEPVAGSGGWLLGRSWAAGVPCVADGTVCGGDDPVIAVRADDPARLRADLTRACRALHDRPLLTALATRARDRSTVAARSAAMLGRLHERHDQLHGRRASVLTRLRVRERLGTTGGGTTGRTLARAVEERLRAVPRPELRKVLITSVQKSGTNLALRALEELGCPVPRPLLNRIATDWSRAHAEDDDASSEPILTFNHRQRLPRRDLELAIDRVPCGGATAAHIWHDPEVEDLLTGCDVAIVLMVRDPRGQLLSEAEWIVDEAIEHPLRRQFEDMDRSARMQALLERRAASPWLERFFRWADRPGVLTVRFEDLVGPAGGGDERRQQVALERLARHVGRDPSATAIRRATENLFGATGTFRIGSADRWRQVASRDQLQLMDETFAPTLSRFGYPRAVPALPANVPGRPSIVLSVPKSGTNLLARTLELLGQARQRPHLHRVGVELGLEEGTPGVRTTTSAAQSILPVPVVVDHLLALGPCRLTNAHAPWSRELQAILEQLAIAPSLIVRDPRAVLLSWADWVVDGKRRSRREDEEQSESVAPLALDRRLEWLRTTLPGGDTLRVRLDAILPWADVEGVAVVRYEDLVGEHGGGSAEAQRQAIETLARHIGIDPSSELTDRVAAGLYGGTNTFRHGQVDRWRTTIPAHHLESLDDEVGDVLDRFGYPRWADLAAGT